MEKSQMYKDDQVHHKCHIQMLKSELPGYNMGILKGEL